MCNKYGVRKWLPWTYMNCFLHTMCAEVFSVCRYRTTSLGLWNLQQCHSNAVKDSCLLECDSVSLGEWLWTLEWNLVSPKHREVWSHWHTATFQNTWIFLTFGINKHRTSFFKFSYQTHNKTLWGSIINMKKFLIISLHIWKCFHSTHHFFVVYIHSWCC